MAQLAKKAEIGANVAIIVAAVALVLVLARNFAGEKFQAHHQIAVGTRFALQNVDWQSHRKTLVFALSTTCHFCTDSAAFYQELTNTCKQTGVRTIALFPQPIPAAESYLKSTGVRHDEVRQSSLGSLEVSGTPTLLLIDGNGTVRNIWVGKLSGETEKEVFAKVVSD